VMERPDQKARMAELADAPALGAGGETRGGSSPPPRTALPLLLSVAFLAGCPPAGPGPVEPIGTSHPATADAGSSVLDAAAVEEAPEPLPEVPVEFGPCMPAGDVLAWARGHGAGVVAEALALYLTDLTTVDEPGVTADRAAGWIRSMQAAPLADPQCASLVVSFWFDPRVYLTDAAGSGPAAAVALFSPALTEPAVSFALCVDGLETCRILRLDDVDGDGGNELLIERTLLDGELPSTRTLYEFPADSDPLPVWISDDDAIRRALFGKGGDTDPTNQAIAGDLVFATTGGVQTLTVEYQLVACPSGGTGACEPSATQALTFTRLGDVFLLPDEPEPGAPWERPGDDAGQSVP
jgi:hypothetical protein